MLLRNIYIEIQMLYNLVICRSEKEAGSVTKGTNPFINFLTSAHRHKERDIILKRLS